MNSAPRLALSIAFAMIMVLSASAGALGSHPSAPATTNGVAPYTGVVTIFANGTISSKAFAPITGSGNVYTVHGVFNGSIVDDRNGSTVNGGGFQLWYSDVNGGNDAGITVNDANGVTIENMWVLWAGVGAWVENSHGTNLTHNWFNNTNLDTGISLWNANDTTIFDNQIYGEDNSIYSEASGDLVVQGNDAKYSAGFDIQSTTNAWFSNNDFSYGGWYSEDCYLNEVEESGNLYFYNDLFNYSGAECYALSLWQVGGVWMNEDNFSSPSEGGVYIEYAGGPVVITWINVSDDYTYWDAFYIEDAPSVIFDNITAYNTNYLLDTYEVNTVQIYDNVAEGGYGYYEVYYVEYATSVSFTHDLGSYHSGELFEAGYVTSVYIYDVTAEYDWDEVVDAWDIGSLVVTNSDFAWCDEAIDIDDYGSLNVSELNANYCDDEAIYADDGGPVSVVNSNLGWVDDEGIELYYVEDVRIVHDFLAYDDDEGVYIEDSSNVLVYDDNMQSDRDEGAYVEDSSDVLIVGNQMNGAEGVDVEDSYNVNISSNDLANADDECIYTDEDTNLSIFDNQAQGCDDEGWYDDESTGVSAIDNDFASEDDDAVDLEYTTDVRLVDDNMSNADDCGVDTWEVTGLSLVDDYLVGDRECGIYLDEDSSVTILNVNADDSDSFHEDEGALYIEESSNVVALDSQFENSGDYGVYIWEDSGITLVNDQFSYSYDYGFYSDEAADLYVEGSSFSYSEYGLYLEDTSTSTFIANQFSWEGYAYYLDEADYGNLIYHNNFAYDYAGYSYGDNAGNNWDDGLPVGGNYWGSLYTGTFLNGIGTTPFVLDSTDQDNYPLEAAWTSPTITFLETGLVAGTTWVASVNSVGGTSDTNAISISEPNGQYTAYTYVVAAVAGYTVSPSTGSGTETATSIVIPVVFTPIVYQVTFQETGLPVGTSWSVSANGNMVSSTTAWLNISLPSGSWTYDVGGVPGFSTSWTGTVTVSGSPTSVTVAFVPYTYAVTFTETGLVTGTSWSITTSWGSWSSTTPTLTAQAPNGTWTYWPGGVAGLSAPSGSITVDGAAVNVAIVFSVTTYQVSFLEANLPAGTSWTVTLDGQPETSTGGSVLFLSANGTYAFAVTPVSGYTTTLTGAVTVVGSSVTVNIDFAPITHAVTFAETGLPAGTSWSVALDGTTTTSTSSAILFWEASGPHTFAVGSVAGFTSSGGGAITVGNANVVVNVTFTPVVTLYTVSFSESGLSSGTSWSVSINGATLSGSSSTLTTNLGNGSYTYYVSSKGGTPSPSEGTLTVKGGPQAVAVSFSSGSSSASTSGLTAPQSYGLGGLVVLLAILAVLGWFLYMRKRVADRPAPSTSAEGTESATDDKSEEAPAPSTEAGADGTKGTGGGSAGSP